MNKEENNDIPAVEDATERKIRMLDENIAGIRKYINTILKQSNELDVKRSELFDRIAFFQELRDDLKNNKV